MGGTQHVEQPGSEGKFYLRLNDNLLRIQRLEWSSLITVGHVTVVLLEMG